LVTQNTVTARSARVRFAPLPEPIELDPRRLPAGPSHKEMIMAKLSSLDDLLVHELQDIYHAEGQILKALPKMAKAASHPDLKAAFEEHRTQTEGQVRRLEEVFKLLGHPAKGK
jgi:hypothetical protein